MRLSRRNSLKLIAVAASSKLLHNLPVHAEMVVAKGSQTSTWNRGWDFRIGTENDALQHAFPNKARQIVDLPHCGVEQPYDVSASFQGICWYRKKFVPAPWMRGRQVMLEFEGAMHLADVWVGERHVLRHEGGYLPFSLDLTDVAESGSPAWITLRLDNRDNPEIPPGRPQSRLDFCYFPGLYRNVRLHVTDKLHITNATNANRTASGGVFVRYEDVSQEFARVRVQVHVANRHSEERSCQVVVRLYALPEGSAAGMYESAHQTLVAGGEQTFAGTIGVQSPRLWSPKNPTLYRLLVQLVEQGVVRDEVVLKIGIRTLRADPQQGFFLNGEHLVPNGANRHQAYPYIGNALSDQAQYRDAVLLKEAGFELVRLAHYPQSPAFLDACDALGLMVIVCIPGWQFFGPSKEFQQNVRQNLRDVIRRDRNHPCAVLWECSLNETSGHDEFVRELVELAHTEYPGDQMLTCGDTEGHHYDAIRYEVPYSGWDDATQTRPNRAHGIKSLHREYGDNQFGGYSRYSRGDGEALMLVQAWNYQTALNQQLGLDYTWGQCIWQAVDNCRGLEPMISTCGAVDQFRLPKFLYAFFQSQRDPRHRSQLYDSGPMVFIANYWTERSPRDVLVFSNCEEIELRINGRVVERRRPDCGPDVKFGDASGFNLNYWLSSSGAPRDMRKQNVPSSVYNGGNCRMLPHPPFTFANVGFAAGRLEATGFLNGHAVATAARMTPGAPTKLKLRAALGGVDLVGDGSDLVIVHAEICDGQGIIVPDAVNRVRFEADGPVRCVGDNPRIAEAGIASILLRSTGGLQPIRLHASTTGLNGAELVLTPLAQS